MSLLINTTLLNKTLLNIKTYDAKNQCQKSGMLIKDFLVLYTGCRCHWVPADGSVPGVDVSWEVSKLVLVE